MRHEKENNVGENKTVSDKIKQRGTKTKWKGQGKCEGLRSRMRGKRQGIRGPQEVWGGGGGRESGGG